MRKLLVAAAFAVASASSLLGQANGRNAVFVTYSGANGIVGDFRQSGEGTWTEQNRGGRNQFRESGRDDWSVYLVDDSRGVNIQLDLHTRAVNYSDRNNPTPSRLYGINAAHAWSNGRQVTRVIAKDGSGREVEFVQEAPGRWQERSSTPFRFRETNRDDWTVYLHDDQRNVDVFLDLHRKVVLFRSGGGEPSPIMTIVVAIH